MAHVKKGMLTRPKEWWKHLKWMKRPQNKGERQASKKDIERRLEDAKVR